MPRIQPPNDFRLGMHPSWVRCSCNANFMVGQSCTPFATVGTPCKYHTANGLEQELLWKHSFDEVMSVIAAHIPGADQLHGDEIAIIGLKGDIIGPEKWIEAAYRVIDDFEKENA